MQKNNFYWLLILIFLLTCCFNNNPKTTQAIFSVAKDTIDFKFRDKNQTTLIPIMVSNVGSANLKIINIKGSCGCTDIKFDTAAIKPGGNSTILLNYKSSGDTIPVLKNIVVETNATPSLKVIFFRGTYEC